MSHWSWPQHIFLKRPLVIIELTCFCESFLKKFQFSIFVFFVHRFLRKPNCSKQLERWTKQLWNVSMETWSFLDQISESRRSFPSSLLWNACNAFHHGRSYPKWKERSIERTWWFITTDPPQNNPFTQLCFPRLPSYDSQPFTAHHLKKEIPFQSRLRGGERQCTLPCALIENPF